MTTTTRRDKKWHDRIIYENFKKCLTRNNAYFRNDKIKRKMPKPLKRPKSIKNLLYIEQRHATKKNEFSKIFVFVPDFVTDFVSDFVTNFVPDFETDFVNKYVTSISYKIPCLSVLFVLQISNYNRLLYSTGIVWTCLGHICYPLKRKIKFSILVKITWKFQKDVFVENFFSFMKSMLKMRSDQCLFNFQMFHVYK